MERHDASVRYPTPDAHQAYSVPGMGIDFSCANDSSELELHVDVAAGELAWSATEPGLDATPAPITVRERPAAAPSEHGD